MQFLKQLHKEAVTGFKSAIPFNKTGEMDMEHLSIIEGSGLEQNWKKGYNEQLNERIESIIMREKLDGIYMLESYIVNGKFKTTEELEDFLNSHYTI